MARLLEGLKQRIASPVGVAFTYLIFGTLWILTSDRLLALTTSDTEVLTTLQTYKGLAYVALSTALILLLTSTMAARLGWARRRLEASRETYRRLMESARDGMWAVDPEGRMVDVNQRLVDILGVDRADLIANGVDRYLQPDHLSADPDAADRDAGDKGTTVVRFRRGNDESGWAIVSSVPLVDSNGAESGRLRVLTDVTRTKRAEDALLKALQGERLLLNELDHRVRNNLAALMTLIDMTRQRADGVSDFAAMIRGRVGAMAATHSLLAESKFSSVELSRLISVIAEAENEHRLDRSGPQVLLGPQQAGPIGMIMQEMWANSAKHGALGSDRGRASISWQVSDDQEGCHLLRLSWRDIDGPAVTPPQHEGFGLSLVRGLTQSDLHGTFDAQFAPTGAAFTIEFPIALSSPVPGRA